MKKQYKLRTSVVCIKNDCLLTFVAIDPSTKKQIIFHPGGKPNSHEFLYECAERETLEETGYKVKVIPHITTCKKYDFVWDGVTYNCETHFYGAHLLDEYPVKVSDAEYNHGVFWCPISQIPNYFNYCQSVLDATKELLNLIHFK